MEQSQQATTAMDQPAEARAIGDVSPLPANPATIDPCDVCDGSGWIVVDAPGFDLDLRLQRCICGQADERERDHMLEQVAILEASNELSVELRALAKCTFMNFYPMRPLREFTWEGLEVAENSQRGLLRAALKTCKAYARNPVGWLYLYGGYGSGKSHLAAAIAKLRIDMGETVIYRSVPGFLDDLRGGFESGKARSIFEAAIACDMLILDDIGAEHTTRWAEERLFLLLNERQDKPTVLTSNISPDDLKGRLASRVAGQAGNEETGGDRVLWLPVSDYRRIGP